MKTKLFFKRCTYALSMALVAGALTTGCTETEDMVGQELEKEYNTFDFSTTKEVSLQVNYLHMSGVKASVYFEVYDEMPVIDAGFSYEKKKGLLPLFAFSTSDEGTFSQKLTLPAYAKKLYIYSPTFYAQTLIEADVVNGVAIANDKAIEEEEADTRASSSGSKDSFCNPVRDGGWRTNLGKYDAKQKYEKGKCLYGAIQYALTDKKSGLLYDDDQIKTLMNAHTSVIDVNANCPQDYRASKDMYFAKKAPVSVTLLGGNTCWNSSMGYYYYQKGSAPRSLDEATVFLLFPNTQCGWEKGNDYSRRGVLKGTAVQLKYYGANYNEQAQDEFPAGTCIGFVLATNGWSYRLPGYKEDKDIYAATTPGFSHNNGTAFSGARTAIYRYKDKNTKLSAVLFSFEDSEIIDGGSSAGDPNFSDVVFTLKTIPADAIIDVPVVDDKKITTESNVGVYAFEDLWPNKGDYDMNDVLATCKYSKTYDSKGIYEESFTFVTYENGAHNANGLGVTLQHIQGADDVTLTIDGKPIKYTRNGDSFLLSDNVKNYHGKEYVLTATYKAPANKDQAGVLPFIWKSVNGSHWEVHKAYECPTAFADQTKFFGTGDDKSDSTTGAYYVSDAKYPFAFFLDGATKENVAPILDPKNAGKPIDQVIKEYADWVKNPAAHSDWYKK